MESPSVYPKMVFALADGASPFGSIVLNHLPKTRLASAAYPHDKRVDQRIYQTGCLGKALGQDLLYSEKLPHVEVEGQLLWRAILYSCGCGVMRPRWEFHVPT